MKMGGSSNGHQSSRLRVAETDANRDIAKFLSGGRAAGRFFLQRVLFRAVVNVAITQKVRVDPAVHGLDGPFVLVANHSSHVDAPILAQGLPRRQARLLATGVAKDYFFEKWYRRWFVRWLFNAYPVDRDGSRQNAGISRRILDLGAPVLVFPEGGRQSSGRLGVFGAGAAANAIRADVPVVPAAIVGAHEAMPKGTNWPKKGRPPVGVVVGEPLHARADEDPDDFTDRIRETVADLYFASYADIVGHPHPLGREEGTRLDDDAAGNDAIGDGAADLDDGAADSGTVGDGAAGLDDRAADKDTADTDTEPSAGKGSDMGPETPGREAPGREVSGREADDCPKAANRPEPGSGPGVGTGPATASPAA